MSLALSESFTAQWLSVPSKGQNFFSLPELKAERDNNEIVKIHWQN